MYLLTHTESFYRSGAQEKINKIISSHKLTFSGKYIYIFHTFNFMYDFTVITPNFPDDEFGKNSHLIFR
jgi:hypothetical protein